MKNKRIKYFIKYGYFDCNYGQVISKRYHMFGEDPTAIYIKKKGFQVVFFVQQKSILFAQIELIAPKKLKNKSLKKLMDYQKPSVDLMDKVLTKILFKNNDLPHNKKTWIISQVFFIANISNIRRLVLIHYHRI